jgi:exodeoxyribonuclease V gamma subunit
MLLQKEVTTARETNVHSIRFSSLRPMRAVPAKVIVLMGMGDGLFPRTEQTNTLNLLLSNSRGDYYPSQVDLDRYIFLEAILSARNYLVLSYVSQKPGDAKKLSPSLLVKELLGYLDQSYCIDHSNSLELPGKCCFYEHPLVPFYQAYFSEKGRLRNYSTTYYKAALSHYVQENKIPHAFLHGFLPKISKEEEKKIDLTIDVKDLFTFAKNPLKSYFNQSLGIYIDKESDKKIQDQTDLFLSDLNAAILAKRGVFASDKEMFMRAESSGKLPQGPFKILGVEKIRQEIERITENMKGCGIDLKEIFSIEMREYYGSSTFEQGVWKIPPFVCEIPSIGSCRLIGRLDDLSFQGKMVFSQEDSKKLFSLWPEWLLLRCLIERELWPISPHLVFVKGKKVKVIKPKESQENPEQKLKLYLKYFLEYQSSPSPLVPDWISSIMSSTEEEINQLLKEKIGEDFVPQFDQYLTWVGRNSQHVDFAASLSYWQTKGQHLFDELFEVKPKRMTSKEDV